MRLEIHYIKKSFIKNPRKKGIVIVKSPKDTPLLVYILAIQIFINIEKSSTTTDSP